MRVLVTGGIGAVGKAVVERLVASRFDVLVVDRQPAAGNQQPAAETHQPQTEIPGAAYACCDILDYPRLAELVRGCDAVVHLAAIPSPGMTPNEALFNINVSGTYNVFQAAAEAGIKRVVQASSINAVGYYYGPVEFPLDYLPMDEAHPSFTSDPYSLSKTMVEEIGRYYWRRDGISSVALRFPAVQTGRSVLSFGKRNELMSGLLEKLLSMSEAERRAWVQESRRLFTEYRGKHSFEDPVNRLQMWGTNDSPIPLEARAAMGARYNFFTLIDDRDAAQAVEKGLTADYTGSHALFANDSVQWTGLESEKLVGLFYPEVRVKRPLVGREALVSIEKAKEVIGFEPEYHFG